jgi:DNA-binding MarR family transcriptional regulator
MDEQLLRELDGYPAAAGLGPADLLALPDQLRRLINWLNRRGGAGLADLAGELACDAPAAAALADALSAKGLITAEPGPEGAARYKVRMAARRQRGPGAERLRDLFD